VGEPEQLCDATRIEQVVDRHLTAHDPEITSVPGSVRGAD
jgi:hypothetical protein